MKIRVLLADDDESIRKWYSYVFSQTEDIELLPMAKNGYEAVSLAAMHKPDVVILDVEMEIRDSGLMAGRQILSMMPETKIIILTVYDDDATIFRAYEMGVTDYLFKDAPAEKVIGAVRDAYSDTTPIRQEIAKRMRSEFKRLKENEDRLIDFLRMIRQLSNPQSPVGKARAYCPVPTFRKIWRCLSISPVNLFSVSIQTVTRLTGNSALFSKWSFSSAVLFLEQVSGADRASLSRSIEGTESRNRRIGTATTQENRN